MSNMVTLLEILLMDHAFNHACGNKLIGNQWWITLSPFLEYSQK